MNFSRSKKALVSSAFFIACFTIFDTQAATCEGFKATETATIRHVHDGDTVNLDDNRKVRLIGIDTPELARKTDSGFTPAQPYAEKARDFVRKLIKQQGAKVQLMPGAQANDHYGRFLYHIQLADGSLLQSRLIEAGLAIAYSTPPNTALSHCYHVLEKQAREKHSGFWTHTKYQPLDVSRLTTTDTGFHIIRGTILHIGESRKAYWLNFSNHFSARIDKRDVKNFKQSLKNLIGKTVLIRGWVRVYKNQKQISLRFPSAIEKISD